MNTAEFLARTYRLVNLYQATQKQPRQYAGGVTLYAAQTHMLEVIAGEAGIMSTELAQRLGVSKGAVSQTLKRLCEKGLVCREAAADGRAVALRLSEAGERVWREHHALHAPLLSELERLAAQFTPETTRALAALGDAMEAHLMQLTGEE